MHEGHRERLRGRYIKHGLDGFEDHEILELLLTFAIPRVNTNDIAHTLLQRFGSVERALSADVQDLLHVPGIGENTAVFLHMHGEIVRRMVVRQQLFPREKRPRLNTPAAAAAYALATLGGSRYECVYAASLDKNLRLLHAELLFTGTLTEAPLYPRRVVESALQNNAYAILLLHNHPSGDPSPSQSDLDATAMVQAALNSIDIRLHDHLIVGRGVVYSCLRGIIIEPANSPGEPPLRVCFPKGGAKAGAAPAELAAEPDSQ